MLGSISALASAMMPGGMPIFAHFTRLKHLSSSGRGRSPRATKGSTRNSTGWQKMNPESIWMSVVSCQQAYNLKAVADYEMGPDSEVPLVRAKAAIANAEEFIVCIKQLLETNSIS